MSSMAPGGDRNIGEGREERFDTQRIKSLAAKVAVLEVVPPAAANAPAKGAAAPVATHGQRRTVNGETRELDGRAEEERRLVQKIQAILGPQLCTLIEEDNDVAEIDRNPDGRLFISHSGKGIKEYPDLAISDFSAANLIRSVAGYMNAEISARSPYIEGTLPIKKCRFTGVMPPVSPAPTFCIRKRSVLRRTFDDYVNDGTLTPAQAEFLRSQLKKNPETGQGHNILIVGPTKVGKTTFANAVLAEICAAAGPNERFAILEDTPELQSTHPNTFYFCTSDISETDMDELLRLALRSAPTIICVGELRGAEAQSLLEAWNTGHNGGITTIHCDTASKALDRLEALIRKANVPVDKRTIKEAVNLIVVLGRTANDGRKCREIAWIEDVNDARYTLKFFRESAGEGAA